MEMLPSLCEDYPIIWKKNRLSTYENWPFESDCTCTRERMAAAGFIYVGSRQDPDLVKCFICDKQLDEWKPDDDPWSEHASHSPSCKYVEIGKQDELDWTIPELLTLHREMARKSLKEKYDLAVTKLKEETGELAKQIPSVDKKKIRKGRKKTTN